MSFNNAVVNLPTAGTSTVIAGEPGKVIRVYALNIQANAITSFSLRSGTSALTGPMIHTLGGTFSLPLTDNNFYFETSVGEDLNINISGLTGSLGGFILYLQVEV